MKMEIPRRLAGLKLLPRGVTLQEKPSAWKQVEIPNKRKI